MEGIKTASVPRARPDIHYLNGLLSLLRSKGMAPKVKREQALTREENKLDLCSGVFSPVYFGA